MLSIGSGLAPKNRTGIVFDRFSNNRHVLSIALHRELLEIGRKPFQILFVRQNRDCLCIKEVTVPNSEQTEKNRQVPLERRCAKMIVDFVEAIEHGAKII